MNAAAGGEDIAAVDHDSAEVFMVDEDAGAADSITGRADRCLAGADGHAAVRFERGAGGGGAGIVVGRGVNAMEVDAAGSG